MAQLAVVLLALFGQMERTYTRERAAHARAVATAKGRRVGRPVTADPAKLDYAAHLRAAGHTVAEIVTKTASPASASTAPAAPAPRARHRRRAARRRSQLTPLTVSDGPPEDRHWGERTFFMSDPDGNTIELAAG